MTVDNQDIYLVYTEPYPEAVVMAVSMALFAVKGSLYVAVLDSRGTPDPLGMTPSSTYFHG